MKRRLLIVIALCAIVLSASAQVKFGLKGGVNVTNMKWNTEVLDPSNRAGFFIGPTIKISLPVTGLGIDASALYDQRSAKVSDPTSTSGEKTLKQQQIAIPVNLRYGWGLGSMASLFLYAGPQFGFNVGGDESFKVSGVDWKWKDSNFSMNVGVGVMLVKHLQLNANYNIACGKTGEISSVADALTTSTKKINAKSNSWQIGLAYYF